MNDASQREAQTITSENLSQLIEQAKEANPNAYAELKGRCRLPPAQHPLNDTYDPETGEIYPQHGNGSSLEPPNHRPTEAQARAGLAAVACKYERRFSESKPFSSLPRSKKVQSLRKKQVKILLRHRRRLPIPNDEQGRDELQAFISVGLRDYDLPWVAPWAEWQAEFDYVAQYPSTSSRDLGARIRLTHAEWLEIGISKLSHINPFDVDSGTVKADRLENRKRSQREWVAEKRKTKVIDKYSPRTKAVLAAIRTVWIRSTDLIAKMSLLPEFKQGKRKVKNGTLRVAVHRAIKELVAGQEIEEKLESSGSLSVLLVRRKT